MTAFSRGEHVKVKSVDAGDKHVRTPTYVRGKAGWIERVHGEFRNPQTLAYGADGLPREPLYMVGFRQLDLWPERYAESRADKLYVDLYEGWLEIVDA